MRRPYLPTDLRFQASASIDQRRVQVQGVGQQDGHLIQHRRAGRIHGRTHANRRLSGDFFSKIFDYVFFA